MNFVAHCPALCRMLRIGRKIVNRGHSYDYFFVRKWYSIKQSVAANAFAYILIIVCTVCL
jgi:hypothetical protein